MNFRQFVQDYLTFNRNERKGIIILLVIILLLAATNKLIFYFETPAQIDTSLLDSLPGTKKLLYKPDVVLARSSRLFPFNPNTIGRESLDSLLLSEGIKRNILKYREKGGIFYSESDFKRMYGVTDSIFIRVKPYLVFEHKIKQPVAAEIKTELFNFDPNSASDDDFGRLGLNEKQIKTIRNYQSKGGSFRRSDDFFKIYGIRADQKEKLAPYVTIAQNEKQKTESTESLSPIEINVSDSIALMRLPGIGTRLSKRIVKYRDLLGGYYSVSQLREVYGLSEQTIEQIESMIIVDVSKVRQVDLNFADWNELAKHPYIQRKLANQIVKFRTRYGSIQDPSVLRDSLILSPEEYNRLKPYL